MNHLKVILSIIGILITIGLLALIFGPIIINGDKPSYFSFAATNFVGHIFFMTVPTEEIIYGYYLSLGYSKNIMFMLAIVSAILAQFIDYSIGFTVHKKFLTGVVGDKKKKKMYGLIKKYGGGVIFFFNFLPLSSPLVCLAAGMLKYDLKKTIYYSLFGLSLKYYIINLLFM